MRFGGSTRFSFGMFFRPKTISATNAFGFVSFVERTSDVSVASATRMDPFGFISARVGRGRFHHSLVKENGLRVPKRLSSIEVNHHVLEGRDGSIRTPYYGDPFPNAVPALSNDGSNRRSSVDDGLTILPP